MCEGLFNVIDVACSCCISPSVVCSVVFFSSDSNLDCIVKFIVVIIYFAFSLSVVKRLFSDVSRYDLYN